MLYTRIPIIEVLNIKDYQKGKHNLVVLHQDINATERRKLGIDKAELVEETLFPKGKTLFLVQKTPVNTIELRNYAATPIVKFKEKYASIGLIIPEGVEECIYHSIIASLSAAYSFQHYKTEKTMKLEKITFYTKKKASEKEIEKAMNIVKGLYIARDIANMPPKDMNPYELEKTLKELVKKVPGLKLKVLGKKELEEKGLHGIIAVGKGSSIEPRLFILEYNGCRKGEKIALVGKAVTFDAGGLDLKSREAMDEMKYDKAGGALIIGLITTLALLKVKKNFVALIPAVENLPGPEAYKPRDIIRMYNGKTVEITNTDAEGRVILADALAYASRELKASKLIDTATLTGAVIIALGNIAAGLFGTNKQMIDHIIEAGSLINEKFWELPLYDEYKEYMKSRVADLVNSGGREAGASLAAIFLKEFTDDKPWVHIDIAGVAWVQRKGPKSPMYQEGATGYGLETLVNVLSN